jgi:hypothetical protein
VEGRKVEWLLLVLVPMVGFRLLMLALAGPSGSSRWRRRSARTLERVAARLRGERAARTDPFEVLRLQMRLAELARQLQALEDDTAVYAKAHRLAATRAAYDDLLDEACRLAGVDPTPMPPRGAARRWEEELALAERGWTW